MATEIQYSETQIGRIQTATPVACGNAWETLPGGERERFCGDCDRSVYNLTMLSAAALTELQEKNPDRLCVVVKPPLRWLTRHPALVRAFGGILLFLFLCQTAIAQSQQTPEPLQPCKNYFFSPMISPDAQVCVDETGRKFPVGEWLKAQYEKPLKSKPDNAKQTENKQPRLKP